MQNFLMRLAEAEKVVFFTGAGVSTPSGLKDFRGKSGLASQGLDFEKLLTRTQLFCNPDQFWKFWNDHMRFPDDIAPNVIHETIGLVGQIKPTTVVTQNIDGLHEQVGYAEVLAIHGGNKIVCTRCSEETTDFPRHKTETCFGRTRPNAVLYEERLDPGLLEKAGQAISDADMVIVCGTSLRVFPAAHLINLCNKLPVYYINNQAPSAEGVYVPMRALIHDLEEFFTPVHEMLSSALSKA